MRDGCTTSPAPATGCCSSSNSRMGGPMHRPSPGPPRWRPWRRRRPQGPFVMADLKTHKDLDEVVRFIEARGLLAA